MKKILLFSGLILSLCAGFNAGAQVSVNVNIGTPVVQERWYTSDDDYYYLPEQGVYYNVRRRVYIFPERGTWLYAPRLPQRYGNYTYRSSRYVRIHDRSPFDRHDHYKERYHHDKGKHKGHGRHR